MCLFLIQTTYVCLIFLFGRCNETDEEIILNNKTLDIANIIDKLSIELQKCLYLVLTSHSNTNTCYKISRRDSFIIPSYCNPNKKLQM